MAFKDFFADIDPLAPMRNMEPQTPVMPALTKEDSRRLDDSFLETFDRRQHTESQEKQDMHIVYSMIDTLRKENAEIKEEIRQRDCN